MASEAALPAESFSDAGGKAEVQEAKGNVDEEAGLSGQATASSAKKRAPPMRSTEKKRKRSRASTSPREKKDVKHEPDLLDTVDRQIEQVKNDQKSSPSPPKEKKSRTQGPKPTMLSPVAGSDEPRWACRYAHLGCERILKNKASEASHASSGCRYDHIFEITAAVLH
eukprot:SAG31_NODE_2212_length_6174_cov_11.856790_8_plen_168_part_00